MDSLRHKRFWKSVLPFVSILGTANLLIAFPITIISIIVGLISFVILTTGTWFIIFLISDYINCVIEEKDYKPLDRGIDNIINNQFYIDYVWLGVITHLCKVLTAVVAALLSIEVSIIFYKLLLTL